MTGEFSTYECEQEMVCGQKCERLYGHRGEHDCGGHEEKNGPGKWTHTDAETDKEAQI